MNQEKTVKHKFLYLEKIRAIACVLVVIGHVSAGFWKVYPVDTFAWQITNAYDCAGVIGVPLFFMISGAIFLNPDYKLSIKDLYCKKLLHIVVVYHVWLLSYNLISLLDGGVQITVQTLVSEVIVKTLYGNGIYHLWFLGELCLLYVISPLLKRIFTDEKICEYYLVVYTIFGIVIPTITPFPISGVGIIQSVCDRSSLEMLTGYIGYFVLGHYLHRYVLPKRISKKWLLLLTGILVISWSANSVICGVHSIKLGEPSIILNTPLALPDYIACICIFILVYHCVEDKKVKKISVSSIISKLSFGIYLAHPFVIQRMQRIGMFDWGWHPIVAIPVFVVIVMLFSGVITAVLQKVPVLRKWTV